MRALLPVSRSMRSLAAAVVESMTGMDMQLSER